MISRNYEGKQTKLIKESFMEEVGFGDNSFHKPRLQNYFSYENSVAHQNLFFKYRKIKKHSYPAHIHTYTYILINFLGGDYPKYKYQGKE